MAFTGLQPDVPQVGSVAHRTPYGMVVLPPGARIAAYVRSSGGVSGDDSFISANLVTTLAAALARVRAGRGDTVVCLPGHSESVANATMLANLVAGARIVGVGVGSNMPVFRWTATASQWVLDDADVQISGLRLRLEGANGVVKAIAATAADCAITDCDIELASGAALKATIGIEIGAGAHRFLFGRNRVRGTATHNVTDGVLVAGVANDVEIVDNKMIASATAGNGLIRVTAAALGLYIARNSIANTMTNSTSGITFGAAASSGIVERNHVAILAASTSGDGSAGVIIGATTLCSFFENYVSDGRNSGLLCPTVAN